MGLQRSFINGRTVLDQAQSQESFAANSCYIGLLSKSSDLVNFAALCRTDEKSVWKTK